MSDRGKKGKLERLLIRGTRLLRAGEAERARKLLERAHQRDPDHFDAALNLSGAYILSGKFGLAVPLLEHLIEREPENAMVWTNLGAAYLGNPVLATEEARQKAIMAFEQALAIDPVAPNAAYNIGLIYRDRRDIEAALHWFREAVRHNPGDRDARNVLARLLSGKADLDTPISGN